MNDKLKITVMPGEIDLEAPKLTYIGDLLAEAGLPHASSAVGAKVNNEFASLMDRVTVNSILEPVCLDSAAGMRIYRNSLAFLLEMANKRLCPHRRLVISHSLGHGLYHRFRDDGPAATMEEVQNIQKMMQELVSKDYLILPDEIPWREAVEIFLNRSSSSTRHLMLELNEPRVGIWRCDNHIAVRHHPLAPRTSLLKTFSVEKYSEGFLLRYPSSRHPGILGERDDEPKLFTVYEEHKKWGEILKVSNVAQLNTLSRNREAAREFIQTAETLHDLKIANLASLILDQKGEMKAVMIAGPSSSGKTTFTKKLALYLKSSGLKPQIISLDDYYKEQKDIPKDEKGKPNLEILEALDIELFNKNLNDLFAGRETEIPIFDFKNARGRLAKGRKIILNEGGILLFEGIHGLNPNLTPEIDKSKTFRIYISALTQLNLEDHVRIPTTDNRLIRRIVRDHQFRQYPAINTLRIWPSVRRGEELHIFPWQGSSNVMFNSALDYELAVLKVFAEPLLRTVSPKEPEYGEARRLMSLLRNVSPFPVEEVPELSILREFIGRSGFRY